MRFIILGAVMVLAIALSGCGEKVITEKAPLEYVKTELNKLAPVSLECDLSQLSSGDKQALAKLVKAAKLIDELFLVQVSPDNPKIREALQESEDPQMVYYLDLFNIMFGPWNRIDHDKPFINKKEKPAGAGFYPQDMTKEEFENFVQAHPDQKEQFESTFTIIQRDGGLLKAVPYHQAYKPLVDQVSQLLQEASALTDDASLKKYLDLRAKAFLTDDYFDSDMAWMDLSGDLEIVIGPYEVYEDKLYNYKAAYEAFLCIVDHEESKKLATVSKYLNQMEANLPIPNSYKNFNRGSSSPIKVVNEIFSAGDTKAGIQTTAFNLPNDERVREAKGSKKVMLKNIARAKFDKCWIPIVNTILAPKPLKHVSFDAYFNHVLMHEMSHGLGPGNITLSDGTRTTVAKELKELYSVIEECKADVLGIYNLKFLIDKGVFPRDMEYSIYASYLGGMFRSIRFGINEAHGGGVAIQFNYYMEKGAFRLTKDGKLDVDAKKIYPAVKSLAHELLMLQARGDYAAAQKLMEKYRVMSPVMQKIIDSLKDVPIDIHPSYPAIEGL